ncbi:flagella synthesis protein FlgN [Solimonas sp. K1W22B-7]|uniref:flagella synthesis protein FlgN n=1 Tax=Solimonas sp. K1W22B-7 TaxID=2303331 RepID=UPI0013C4DDCD|nr:flagellar protein FlgN [Solimonas sp. K1W22B-7]
MTANPWAPQPLPLTENLRQQLEHTRQLLTTLDAEKQALLADDADQLEQVTAAKSAAAETLRRLGEPVLRLRATQGPLNAYFARLPEATRLLADWAELQTLAQRCQRANQDNAMVLEVRHRQVRQTLQNLRGEAPQQTYGRGGYGAVALGGQRLGSA